MGKTEAIVEVVAVFLISLFLSGIIYLYLCFGTLDVMVYWFGIIWINLWVIIVALAIGLVASSIVLGYMYFREYKKKEKIVTKFEAITYIFVILLGIGLTIISHFTLLPVSPQIRVLIMDLILIAEIILVIILLGMLIFRSKKGTFIIIKEN